MTTVSMKRLSGVVSVARSKCSIFLTVGGLAIFLIVASFLLLSCPINSLFQGYFQEVTHFKRPTIDVVIKEASTGFHNNTEEGEIDKKVYHVGGSGHSDDRASSDGEYVGAGSVSSNSTEGEEIDRVSPSVLKNDSVNSSLGVHDGHTRPSDAKIVAHKKVTGSTGTELSSDGKKDVKITVGSVTPDNPEVMETDKKLLSGIYSENATSEARNSESASSEATESRIKPGKAESRSCDLYQGKWVNDPAGPLYTNNTCPFITQTQNCQGNGRPDKDYENYRWKPNGCDLPRFNPRKFLELMSGKTLAFIGDSVARNQMESMLCILWQEEQPKNRGKHRMQRWRFRSTSTTIVRIWSSWLVHQSADPFQFAPKGITKVFLDIPDETFMEFLPSFDVVVLSSGHWFAKQSAYILNNNIVGGQLWWPKDAGKMKINNIEAFGISAETSMKAIANNPNFTGVAIVRSYSPDHYESRAWNTGGSCTGKVSPLTAVVRNGFTDAMHEKQIAGLHRALEKSDNSANKLRLMDITEAFGYRADGHPGPYRSPDPNKKTNRGPNGEPPPQDCLHWCMPGPVDAWNEILMEVIRREFEGARENNVLWN